MICGGDGVEHLLPASFPPSVSSCELVSPAYQVECRIKSSLAGPVSVFGEWGPRLRKLAARLQRNVGNALLGVWLDFSVMGP